MLKISPSAGIEKRGSQVVVGTLCHPYSGRFSPDLSSFGEQQERLVRARLLLRTKHDKVSFLSGVGHDCLGNGRASVPARFFAVQVRPAGPSGRVGRLCGVRPGLQWVDDWRARAGRGRPFEQWWCGQPEFRWVQRRWCVCWWCVCWWRVCWWCVCWWRVRWWRSSRWRRPWRCGRWRRVRGG